jgi:hypothetical protein
MLLPLGFGLIVLAGCGGGGSNATTGVAQSNSVVLEDAGPTATARVTTHPLPKPFYPKGSPLAAVSVNKLPEGAVLEPKDDQLPAGATRCQAFAIPRDSYWVTVASRQTPCPLATAVIHAYWLRLGVHHHGGDSSASSWATLDQYPGWRCYEAAGAGQCRNGHQLALYGVQNMFRPGG